MRAAATIGLTLLGISVVAATSLIAPLRNHLEKQRGSTAQQQSATAADRSERAETGPSIAETPAERARTEQARKLLSAALLLGAAATRNVSPAKLEPGEAETAAAAAEPPVADAHDNRRRILENIEASGTATGDWTNAAPAVFSAMKGSAPTELARHINVRHVECFEKACVADVSYADMATFEKAAPLFLENDAFDTWPGPRGRTAPEVVASGRVEVTWMLMNPNEGSL